MAAAPGRVLGAGIAPGAPLVERQGLEKEPYGPAEVLAGSDRTFAPREQATVGSETRELEESP